MRTPRSTNQHTHSAFKANLPIAHLPPHSPNPNPIGNTSACQNQHVCCHLCLSTHKEERLHWERNLSGKKVAIVKGGAIM